MLKINTTGVYLNTRKNRYEAWAVNQKTGEAMLFGWIDYGITEKYPEAKRIWERRLWQGNKQEHQIY